MQNSKSKVQNKISKSIAKSNWTLKLFSFKITKTNQFKQYGRSSQPLNSHPTNKRRKRRQRPKLLFPFLFLQKYTISWNIPFHSSLFSPIWKCHQKTKKGKSPLVVKSEIQYYLVFHRTIKEHLINFRELKYEENRVAVYRKSSLRRKTCFELVCHSINEFLSVQIMLPWKPACKNYTVHISLLIL